MWKAALARMSQVFPPPILRRGEEYEKMGHVLNLRLSEGLLKAQVKGSANHIYTVHLDLKHWPEQSGNCTCPQRINCKHIAASLLALKTHGSGPKEVQPSREIPAYYSVQEEQIDAEDVEWYSELNESSNDFFSYQLGILINNKTTNIVPLISELIARWDEETLESLSENLLLKLPIGEGKVLKITLKRLKPLLRFLFKYGLSEKTPTLDVRKNQLLLLLEAEQAMAAAKARWQGTEEIRKKLHALTTLNSLPDITPPQNLKATLRDYQQQGLNWLSGLRSYEFGGVLADDMGLGKTVQTLALLQYEKEANRPQKATLIIAPTSVVRNWENESRTFCPQLKVLIYHGSERHQDTFDGYDIIISTYGLVQRDKTRFLKYHFYYLILDEAQAIKNARAKTTQIVHQLKSDYRLCLTGTPMENHLGELWSLFHFLMPGFLGTPKQFKKYFRNPIEKEGDEERKIQLVQRIQPFLLRRTKNQVAKELPLKTETTLSIELQGKQRDLYEAIRLTMEKKVREAIMQQGINRSHILILDALLKLRQVCCDPRLLKIPEAEMAYGESAKLEALMELLDNLIAEGRKVLIFSQFTSMLTLIEEAIQSRKYNYLKLTGSTTNRQPLIDEFQKGNYSLFLISLKAGGVGLNLTRADTVIHYDPWWNPAIEGQATDRTHRIGQQNPVFVYKLVTSGTVEEAILKLQNKKKMLIEGVLSMQKSGNLILTEEDIAHFFKPLS
ncbi:DNA helicase, SNF2/RAD54 family domain protein (plasmid) [Legionella adelaidensis]|uniref:DNA helicase, SNF2/RAD54 family domain protein n=2 Tax=Legionella adelaidensis TaxID=45056 RepID=A0A0W0R435_9GAMM|nr:DEAD/DEAH box helicase [Legionella adelaidensis]KTC65794.1 SNF2/RAD54 family transporter domain-containing protein [Legionella adelaidensis]VEH85222.1 DNA helicase, SNF2/RAD54 family domain protein [Legionella adelaidensis]